MMMLKDRMKIYYFSTYNILRPRTNQISDLKFCEGFAENNMDIELVVPSINKEGNIDKTDILKSYDLSNHYKMHFLKTFYLKKESGFFNQICLNIYFNLFFIVNFIKDIVNKNESVVISKHSSLLWMIIILKKSLFKRSSKLKVLLWAHEIGLGKHHRFVYKNASGIIATNSAIVEDLKSIYHLSNQHFILSFNPISNSLLENRASKSDARKMIGVKCNDKIVVYSGKLVVDRREPEYIILAAQKLPAYDFIITGGKPEVVEYYKKWCEERRIGNVHFTGYFKNYSAIKYYQIAADVLVSYYSKNEHNINYNLPAKIAEYMASGNPIVIPNYSATRDILNDENVFYVESENVESLADGIRKAMTDKIKSSWIAANAFSVVKELTFTKRTKLILDFIHGLN